MRVSSSCSWPCLNRHNLAQEVTDIRRDASGDGDKHEDEVKNKNEDGCNSEGFRPEFTHQLFDEERIEGFEEGEISIRVLYTPTSLHFLVKIQTRVTDASRYAAEVDLLSNMTK